MAKILCISGPSSSGKTSLLNLLASDKCKEEFKKANIKIQFYPEFIRTYVKNYSNKSFQEICESPIDAFNLQINICDFTREQYSLLLNSPSDIVILDRSPLDLIVYLFLNYMSLPENKMISQARIFQHALNDAKELATYVDINYLTTIDVVNYLPENDGFRPKQYIIKRALEIELFNLISLFPNIKKLPDGLETRASLILDDILKLI